VNPFEIYKYLKLNNYANEDLIGCQIIINICTLKYRNQNTVSFECTTLKNNSITNENFFYTNYDFLNDDFPSIRYSLDPDIRQEVYQILN